MLLPIDVGLHASIDEEVKTRLQGKNFHQLDEMQSQVEAHMHLDKAIVWSIRRLFSRGYTFQDKGTTLGNTCKFAVSILAKTTTKEKT